MDRPDVLTPMAINRRAEEHAQQLLSEFSQDYLQLLIKHLRENVPRKRGRPKGTGEDDSARLLRMHGLLVRGEAKNVPEAASLVATEDPGHSVKATERRIRDKYREEEGYLERLEAANKLREKLFAEENVPWQL